jgi:hypothetical protein
VITAFLSCKHCGYKKKEIDNLDEKETIKKDDSNFEKDRARFCLSEKDGEEYIQSIYNLELLSKEREQAEERKRNKHIYDAVAKLKKLNIADLQHLLIPALKKEGYDKLELAKPYFLRGIMINFTIQDLKQGRSEYDSKKELEKTINSVLNGTNWKMTNDGACYLLGVLKGSLRGLDSEEELVKLVKTRDKKFIHKPTIDKNYNLC